jgi:cytochrome b561
MAHWLMSVYALLEIVLGFLAVFLLREERPED